MARQPRPAVSRSVGLAGDEASLPDSGEVALDEAPTHEADSPPTPEARSAEPLRSGGSPADFAVPFLFMASGAASLIYQVVWTRDLVLVFGNTTQAIVTTVTAFLAGLGIGSLVGGSIGRRLRRPLRLYGCLEIATAALALLMPLAFDWIATVFRHAYLSLPAGEVALIRFLLTFVALAPVTIIMGMTLPVLTRHLVRRDPDVGGRIARLYGLNTLGAVAGTFVSGYVLIGLLGLRGTSIVAVILNLTAGAGAFLIAVVHRAQPPVDPAPAESELSVTEPRRGLSHRQVALLGVTFVSGLVSLALEVLWTRVLIQATGSSIYIFVAVLGTFLAGIAVGSLVYEHDRARILTPRIGTLGSCFAAAALLALVPMIFSNQYGPYGLVLAVGFIFPVTALFGYTFPLTVRLFVQHASGASRGVGVVYAANTAGCVAGTVLAGFVLVPTLGTNASIVVLCVLAGAMGLALATRSMPRRAWQVGFALIAIGALVASLFAPVVRLTYTQQLLAGLKAPTAHFEDNIAEVDVVGGAPGNRRLYINGVSITRLTIDTKLLAYLPKVLRPGARRSLVICFGMGTTYRSSIILGMHTDAVELDPTVPKVMSWFYRDAAKYLHSPLGHVIIGDGRNYVRLTNKRYDIIVVDSPPPVWSAGTVVLMTQEFYQEAAARLTPGGVMGAWLPIAGSYDTKLFLRTFRSVFRYVTVVSGLVPYGYYAIGSQQPLVFHAGTIERTFGTPAARADLANAPDYPPVRPSSWPSIIEHHIWLVNSQVNSYAGPGPLLTDDHPLSEYYLVRP